MGSELSYSVQWADRSELFTLAENSGVFVQVLSRQAQTAPILLNGVAVVCR